MKGVNRHHEARIQAVLRSPDNPGRTVEAGERVRHDPECRDPSCELCKDVTGPLVDYEVLSEDGDE